MDPVTVIVAALSVGAAKGLGDTASTAVADAYRGLKSLLVRVFGGDSKAELVLTEHESDPDTWQAPMTKLLTDTGAVVDEQVLAAARKVLELADSSGSRAGKYVIDVRGANIGAIGDRNQQYNVFGSRSGD
ncbi:hypothetical protein [Nocardia cerradoensis]|uniref:RHIM domain-containing protein n=1 Tax=Nocardia cerradoensis TaxID=85688 RepID=A0A231H594_9NOCA|nr:hypothetical protein [Nocardia cerradoensis]NKY44277.1 hypothetical protein [Nocardia cerradoensis]OXR44010.1 hypothetical protein B7C42_03566 [Nocardia cerradoensis]